MPGRLPSFRTPSNDVPNRVVRTRYGLRESETKPRKPATNDQSIVTYAHPGRGVSGESSN